MENSFQIREILVQKLPEGFLLTFFGKSSNPAAIYRAAEDENLLLSEIYMFQDVQGDINGKSGRTFKLLYKEIPETVQVLDEENRLAASITGAEIRKRLAERPVSYSIDHSEIRGGSLILSGWAYAGEERPIEIDVQDSEGESLPYKARWSDNRQIRMYFAIETAVDTAFEIEIPLSDRKPDTLEFAAGDSSLRIQLGPLMNPGLARKTWRLIRKGSRLVRQYGLKGTISKTAVALRRQAAERGYHAWLMENRLSPAEWHQQRKTRFSWEPKISLVVATYNTPIPYLKEMIDSVLQQTYQNWELCIADGSTEQEVLDYILENVHDPRIRVEKLEENYGIAGNMNAAISMTSGDFIGFYDHDDTIEPDLLYEVVKKLQEFPYDMIYTDEDKLNSATGRFELPNFKPDYSEFLLRSLNYITHFLILSRPLLEEIGPYDPQYEGSQDYDLTFRAAEKANRIGHIPRVLYHWRIHPDSTAQDPASKMYCFEAGRKAIQDHLDRIGTEGTVEMMPDPYYGLYRTRYTLHEDPKISIVLRNGTEKQMKDLFSAFQDLNSHQNFEIVAVSDRSGEISPALRQAAAEDERIQLYELDAEKASEAEVLNYGAFHSHGSLLLFINPSVRPFEKTALDEMAVAALQPEAGAVTGKLIGPSGLISQYGSVLRKRDLIAPAFAGHDYWDASALGKNLIVSEFSVLPADCLMVSREQFMNMGGFNEKYSEYGFDADLCLRLIQSGRRNIGVPFALFQGEKRKPVSSLAEPQKKEFRKAYAELLEQGDPAYNLNYAVFDEPFQSPGME